MRMLAVSIMLLGLAGCVSLPSVSKANFTGAQKGQAGGLPTIDHRTDFGQGMDGARDGRLDPERTAPNS